MSNNGSTTQYHYDAGIVAPILKLRNVSKICYAQRDTTISCIAEHFESHSSPDLRSPIACINPSIEFCGIMTALTQVDENETLVEIMDANGTSTRVVVFYGNDSAFAHAFMNEFWIAEVHDAFADPSDGTSDVPADCAVMTTALKALIAVSSVTSAVLSALGAKFGYDYISKIRAAAQPVPLYLR
jgi:hypothetical protein